VESAKELGKRFDGSGIGVRGSYRIIWIDSEIERLDSDLRIHDK